MPTCKLCSYEGSKESFPKAAIINNIQYYRRVCTSCYSKQKDKARKDKFSWLTSYKKTLSCSHCKSTDYRVFEFHHVDPSTKRFAISNLTNRNLSKENIMKEIQKCICLCANCHRILHYRE